MKKLIVRYGRKIYLKIPYGEIQFGLNTHSIILWYKGKVHILKRANYVRGKRKWKGQMEKQKLNHK